MKIQYVIYKEKNEQCIFALPEIKIQACPNNMCNTECPNKVCIELVHEIIKCVIEL